jgi:hypothetical protein
MASRVPMTAPSLPRRRPRQEPRLQRRPARRLLRPRLQGRRLPAASSAVPRSRRRRLSRRVQECSASRRARPKGSSHSLLSGSALRCNCGYCPSRSRRPTAGGSADRRLDDSASPRTAAGLPRNSPTDPRKRTGTLRGDKPPWPGGHRCDRRPPRHTHAPFPEDQSAPPRGCDPADDPAGNISLSSQRDARCLAERHLGALPREETPTPSAHGLPPRAQLSLQARRHGHTNPLTPLGGLLRSTRPVHAG